MSLCTRSSRASRPTAENMRSMRLLAHQDRAWELIEQGAHIYVCGNARTLAPGVRATLQQIYASKNGGTAAEAETWLAGLRRDHRYLEDIWGAN